MKKTQKIKGKQKPLAATLAKIGYEFKVLRKKKGFKTLKDFVKHYHLPPIQYWRIEKGKANLTIKTLLQILAIHKLSLEEFFCYINDI